MPTLHVTLKRSPRSLIVGDLTIVVEPVRGLETQSEADLRLVTEAAQSTAASPQDACLSEPARSTESVRSAVPVRPAVATMPSSVATIVTDAKNRVVTPLAQSNAVPVLSGATHEVVTAAEVGFGGASEEEVAEIRQLLANAAEMVVELQLQHRQSLAEMQEVAVELASAAASWLVGYAIDRNLFAVDDLIRTSLQKLGGEEPVRVHLNPADHDLLKTLLRDLRSRDLLEQVSCVEDATLPRGSCRVESGRRILVTDMHSRLEDIRRLWMEKLDDSQVERRGDGSASRTLRRFPDRRETA